MVHPVVVVAAPPILANVSLEVAAARKEESLIDRYPLLAKSASMGVTYGLADVAAQLFSWLAAGEVIPLAQRLRRSVSLMFVGCFAVGPLLAIWFDLLEFLVPGRKPRAIATRTALDQIVQVPIMICIIFSLSALAEGHTLAFCLHKCQEKLVPTWRDCVGIWTPAQLINQGFVPLKYRVLFQAVISFFWDTYLSIVAHSVTPPLVVVAS
ncbi:hypothetical protein CTAYLR_000927 [Chrysophaeum taylorii]|uniref:Uncharacterized protein n=1 Tax=Chrysophaeum taylorii TaxID=2483200 RepID=A0AAD7XMP0_9STRA|nr:hypothetical protein CTAYLR_000927 [Chrysophaeum taylorii]